MLLDFTEVVAEALEAFRDSRDYFITKIACTHPVCLVFFAGDEHPSYVFKANETRSLEQSFKTLSRLHATLGDLVPEPLLLLPFDSTLSVLVQRGVQGVPWFEVQRHLGRKTILTLAQRGLAALHAAIAKHPPWRSQVSLGSNLAELANQLVLGKYIDETLATYLDRSITRLSKLPPIDSFRQHGDFCLNNLLFSDRGVHVIDFDDFGVTSTPLYDYLTLAQSLGYSPANPGAMLHSVSDYLKLFPLPAGIHDHVPDLWLTQLCCEFTQSLRRSEDRQSRVLRALQEAAAHVFQSSG